MKFLSFATTHPIGHFQHLGVLVKGDADTGEIIDLTAAARTLLAHEGTSTAGSERIVGALAPNSLLDFIQGGPRGRELADEAVAYVLSSGEDTDPIGAQIRYGAEKIEHLPAIISPPLLRDFMAFEKHLLNIFPKLGRPIPEEWHKRPVYYKGNPSAIGGHRQKIEFPEYAEFMDLEFEFAAIIGTSGVDIPVEKAKEHIFGYTIYNDLSARVIQSQEMSVGLGPAKGKDFLGGHVLGPIVVTADELQDPYGLSMKGLINGVEWTNGSSKDMHWKFEQMIAYASWNERIQVGEVFGSGTVGGGSGAEQDKVLNPGDLIELTIDGIGTLSNQLVRNRPFAPNAGKHGGA